MQRATNNWQTINHDHYLVVLNDPWFKNIVSIQDEIIHSTNAFWRLKGLKSLLLPITTGSISSPMGLGSDSTPVKVNLMGIDTYLADSMQFGLEYGCRLSEKGAFYVMPSFRGEDCDETHLAQFFHSEAEVPGDLESIMRLVEEYLKVLTNSIIQNHSKQLFKFVGDLRHIYHFLDFKDGFQRMTFDEAAKYLDYNPLYIKSCIQDNYALTRAGEQKLTREISPVLWITHFHHKSVPFYQAYDAGNERLALAADLLMGPGEIVGSGERHYDDKSLMRAIENHCIDPAPYQWYINMKRHYPIKTAGFGLGVERYLMWLMNHTDIRDFQIMPRVNGVNILP